MDIFENCLVLKLAVALSLMIYEETDRLKNKEHYSSGVGNKMRNHSDKVVKNIRDGWRLTAGAKKAQHFSEALDNLDEIYRLMEISIRLGFVA